MPFLRRKWKLHEIPSILKYAGSVFNSGWFGIFCAWTGLASNGTGTVVLDLDTHSPTLDLVVEFHLKLCS